MSKIYCSSLRLPLAVVAAAGLFAVAPIDRVYAHGGGGDIALFTTPDGLKVDVGFAVLDDDDIHQVFFDPNESVFQSILLPRSPSVLPPIPYAIGSPEPGFDADENALPPLRALTVNTLELAYWDGTGPVDFAPAVGISGGYAPQPGTTFADGGYHSHPVFGLLADSIPNGVYLAKLNVSISGLADSDPYYLVALVDSHLYTGNSELDAENAEVLGERVRNFLAEPTTAAEPVSNGKNFTFYAHAVAYAQTLAVPEPNAFALLAIAVVGMIAARRRLGSVR